jgi:hypothetical protein
MRIVNDNNAAAAAPSSSAATGPRLRWLLVPKSDAYEDPKVSFAPVAAQRANLRTVAPPRAAATVLRKIGLASAYAPTSERKAPPGRFAELSAIGLTAAFFNSPAQRDDAIGDLSEQFEFVPDFRLAVPRLRRGRGDDDERRARPRSAERQWPADSGVARAHAAGNLGADVLVGVIDTGVDADHDEFRERELAFRYVSFFPNHPDFPSRDVRGFDVDGHGTHVCSILAGKSTGVAPASRLHVASVIESETMTTSMLRTVYGLNWLLECFSQRGSVRKPAVLNLSMGFGLAPPEGIRPGVFRLHVQAMRLIVSTLVKSNVLPVAAVGNQGRGAIDYPAAFGDVMAVGAVDYDGQRAAFSGSGTSPDGAPKPDLMGYGVDVHGAIERDTRGRSLYTALDGTSMAAPFAAGVAVLTRAARPRWSVAQTLAHLRENAAPLSARAADVGAGLARFAL